MSATDVVRVLPGFLRPRVGQTGSVVGHATRYWAGGFHSTGDAMTINVRFPDGATVAFGPTELEEIPA